MNLAGKQIGNYVAKSELGSGGMGVVYLCEHPLIRRRVAAKVLHEDLAASEEIVSRLFDEARAANEISSEHIIDVLDFGRMTDEGRSLAYLIMELLEGEGLGNRLWRVGLTIDETLHIVRQCCEALEASHKAGIVHRDLKPENIFLLDRRGDPNFVKILDFGIAKVSGSPSTKTRTGVLLGTPHYMSPEQCRGAGTVDARADIYSLGIVLYELCTGDVPFNGVGYGTVLLSQMMEEPKRPSLVNKDLPRAIEQLILRALEKDPARRYQSMAEMGEAIAGVQEQLSAKQPIAQIPRKGLHQRDTLVSTGRDRASAVVKPTPVDPKIGQQMAELRGDVATEMMAAVDPATLLDAQVPDAVRALHQQATQLREAPSAHSTGRINHSTGPVATKGTGPEGMHAPSVKTLKAATPLPAVTRMGAAPTSSGVARTIMVVAAVAAVLIVGLAYLLR